MTMFSVIIPSYNSAEYIAETIESVMTQTCEDYEIIVVDDGSTDSSMDVLHRFAGKISLFRQPNSGVSAARNAGARLANGTYLAFLDSDDIWLNDKLEKQSLKLSGGYDICYSNKYNFGDIGDLPLVQTDVFHMPEGFIFEDLLYENVMATSSVVIKKSLFEEIGGFNENLVRGEDWDLWLRCAEKHPIGVNLEPLIKYRLRSNSLSGGYISMNSARETVVKNALATDSGRSMPMWKRLRVLATAYSCSAWESAKAHDKLSSLLWYMKSLVTYPFIPAVWYDLARMISGRV